MRTIIAGSRDLTDYALVEKAVRASGFDITLVLSGRARGVDRLGERWAKKHAAPVELYPADWESNPKAGKLRNVLMVSKADALVAVWDGDSPGTAHCIEQARARGLRVYVWRVSDAH